MKGMSRLSFALSLTVILSLTLLLTLLLALLANLFFSLLRRRVRQCREESRLPDLPVNRPLSFPFYGHGVIEAPTKFLLSIPTLEEAMAATQASPSPPPVDDFVCISNPIYDVGTDNGGGDGTPFVTAKASPSGLEVEEDGNDFSPPLKVMKKLPPALPIDGRESLGTSTETNRPSSSSSSNSLCSSPSW